MLYCSCDGLFHVETPVLVWRFSLVSLAPSSLLPLLSFWNSCLDLGPQNCSSYFPHISGLFVFYHWGVFMFFLLYCCVCGWMGVIVLPSSATTLRVLLLCASKCLLLLRQCCPVLLLCLEIECFSPLCNINFLEAPLFCFCHFSSGSQ